MYGMWKVAALLLATCVSWGADADPWAKVKGLKTGSDLRIYKTGVTEPVTAQYGDMTERKLVVIIKNAETAINKTEIERIDYHPPAGKPVKTTTYDASSDANSESASMSIFEK